jgi:hypothetical protein
MAGSPAPPSTPTPAPSTSVPWYAHVGIGFGLLAAGIALMKTGDPIDGAVAIGAGLSFLGVGSGVAASA